MASSQPTPAGRWRSSRRRGAPPAGQRRRREGVGQPAASNYKLQHKFTRIQSADETTQRVAAIRESTTWATTPRMERNGP